MEEKLGPLLREWRHRRGVSQLDLAYDAGTSARHISFLETGRSSPSREMLLRLAKQLKVPIRDRNSLLLAAGFAPDYKVRSLDDPVLEPAKKAIEQLLKSHEPYPALAIDRHWNVVFANGPARLMMEWSSPELLSQPFLNFLRLAFHPNGFADRIANLDSIKAGVLARLKDQIRVTGDPVLKDLLAELSDYPPSIKEVRNAVITDSVLARVQFKTEAGLLSFFSATTVFGSPHDITLSEIAIESYFPADQQTATALLSGKKIW